MQLSTNSMFLKVHGPENYTPVSKFKVFEGSRPTNARLLKVQGHENHATVSKFHVFEGSRP